MKRILTITTIIVLAGCKGNHPANVENIENKAIPEINYVYINSFPHDINSFTEGFLVYNGKLYESTGSPGELPNTRSLCGVVDTSTGKIDIKIELNKDKYFGEGITFLNGKLFQLTYKTKVGFIYDAITFKKTGEFPLPVDEGWGMTTDGKNLILSDGTEKLTYLDPINLTVAKKLSVTENGNTKNNINELEFINDFIYANVYTTNNIVKIDPATGKIIGILNLQDMFNEARSINPGSLEMNGIAYDPSNGITYITGKMWPKIYVIKLD